MIRAIVFDFGRVISAQKPMSLFRDYEDELGLEAGVLNATMFGHPAWEKVLVGHKSVDEYWEEIGPLLGLHTPRAVAEFRRRYGEDEAINEGVLDLIRALHGRYKLAVLSNSPAGLANWLADWEIDGLFDVIFCSGDEGVAKPDAEAFERTLDRLGVVAAETVFVDDSPRHVAAARLLGIRAIQFTTAEALARRLESLLAQP